MLCFIKLNDATERCTKKYFFPAPDNHPAVYIYLAKLISWLSSGFANNQCSRDAICALPNSRLKYKCFGGTIMTAIAWRITNH